tara:strand:+ start:159 stop:617 length:459 start_codon:yes stop_codon:yes gene_type:complete
MPIKSFRGKIGDGEQQTISLHTNNGSIGYKIKKFQIMIVQIGNANEEHVVKICSVPQNTVNPIPTSGATVDFSDNTLLAVAQSSSNSDAKFYPEDYHVVFDNVTFNQDIYITHTDNESNADVNYYIELEQIKLSLDENTVATLKDIRNIVSQ